MIIVMIMVIVIINISSMIMTDYGYWTVEVGNKSVDWGYCE